MRLTRRQDEGERATSDIAAGVEFGSKAAARSAERFDRASPFFMPTAQWWARTTVLSVMSARPSQLSGISCAGGRMNITPPWP
ncbi:hypothetical protein ABIC44_002725 [Sphingomonas sp. 1185]